MQSTIDSPPAEASPEPGDFQDLFEQFSPGEELSDTGWLTELHLADPRRNLRCLSRGAQIRKRIVDIVGASFLLLVTSPVMLTFAALVKLTSPGPLIYKQLRVGLNLRESAKTDRRQKDVGPPEGVERRVAVDRRIKQNFGRPFVLYKFRSMRVDAETNGAQLAAKNDPRVTRIGRFMRLTRIDELPQLINVLKGDMSLVGPRPERPFFIEQLSDQIPNYLNRLGLKPGVTGVAQVLNGYDNDIESFRRKVAYDLLYLQNCCTWNDFKILLRTIKVVLTGHGAR
ncbi:MAG: sugar transferase [Planctomycetaceae bacterium]